MVMVEQRIWVELGIPLWTMLTGMIQVQRHDWDDFLGVSPIGDKDSPSRRHNVDSPPCYRDEDSSSCHREVDYILPL